MDLKVVMCPKVRRKSGDVHKWICSLYGLNVVICPKMDVNLVIGPKTCQIWQYVEKDVKVVTVKKLRKVVLCPKKM